MAAAVLPSSALLMGWAAEDFPLEEICATFPEQVDERIDASVVQSCTGKFAIGVAQALYAGDQYAESPDPSLELAANQPGLTALMLAAMMGDCNAARLLLRRGASVGLVNCYGRTALMLACMRGHEEMVKLLLSVDVPTDVVDSTGRDALAWAEARQHKRIAIQVRAAAHARRDWRMAQLKERSAQRAAHANGAGPAGGGGGGGSPQAADQTGSAAHAAAATVSARYAHPPPSGKTPKSSRGAGGYAAPTSGRAPTVRSGRIGPIGLGHLSGRRSATKSSSAHSSVRRLRSNPHVHTYVRMSICIYVCTYIHIHQEQLGPLLGPETAIEPTSPGPYAPLVLTSPGPHVINDW